MTKIKINGKEANVNEGDDVVVEPTPAPVAPVTTGEPDDIEQQAKNLANDIVNRVQKDLNLGDTSKINAKVDKILKAQFGESTKLKQILNGKDLYDADELTKEEKILGFFYGLVSKNEHVLKALSEGGDGADGGYLFPNEFLSEVLRDLPEINVMRNWVKVIPMKRDKMDITNLVSPLTVFWTAENQVKSTTTARFATQTLTAFKLAAILYSSDELIEDSTETDVVALIISLFSEAIAVEEERVIWQGNGTTQPQGLSVATVAGISGTGNAYDDITRLYYSLDRRYVPGAAFFMNGNTARSIELIKDTTGRPLFVPSATDGIQPTLKGKPLVISNWVPDRQVYFGDLKKAYFLGDRKRMSAKVSQDTETAFTKDQTAIRVVARIAGRVVFPNAVRKASNF